MFLGQMQVTVEAREQLSYDSVLHVLGRRLSSLRNGFDLIDE